MPPEVGGELAVDPAFVPVADVPGLPRVLLIGDSISVGYTLPVRARLSKTANTHRAPENCGPTFCGIANVEKWLGTGKWDVIHFNFGLHDLRIMPDGKHQAPLPQYEANLRQLTARFQAAGAVLVWASTTPVPEGKVSPRRCPEDVLAYNAAAQRIMNEKSIHINDLYAFALPRLAQIQQPVNVHFTPEGSELLGEQVALSIQSVLRR